MSSKYLNLYDHYLWLIILSGKTDVIWKKKLGQLSVQIIEWTLFLETTLIFWYVAKVLYAHTKIIKNEASNFNKI